MSEALSEAMRVIDPSQALVFNAFHRSPLLKSIADLGTDRYLEVNDAFCARTGFTRDEMIGKTAVELGLIDAPERDRLARELMALISAGKQEALELTIRARDGQLIHCRYWGQVQQTTEGVRLFAAAEDVTEVRREQAARDAALRELNERFALAMEATSDGLWDWDVAQRRGYLSPAHYRMLGYAPGEVEVSPRAWRELLHPDDREAAEQMMKECVLGTRARFELEYRVRAKSGEWRWLLCRGDAVARDANGKALRVLGTHVDVTERKRLQASLAQSDRLASMGMLAAGVAHEINNPLAYVMTSLETLALELQRLSRERPAEAGDLLECAQHALDGTERIRKISRALSTFSRVERSERVAVDVNVAMENAAAMAQNEVKYRATLIKQLGATPPVLASDGKLAQVFLNLVINAAHAIAEGHAEQHRITLRTWAEGHDVFAEVTDTGVGIPPEHLERVFEPFFTTKRSGVGSGLGLAISRRIVSEFQGEISLQSTRGEGTRVLVRLPAYVPTAATPLPSPAPAPNAEENPRGRILVVDDEDLIRRALARQLKSRHDVVTASSGREAQALLERDTAFDVIFCDLMMPEMTGMELHAWLVHHAPALARRVVFVSGGVFTQGARDYLAGVDNVRLEKPFELKTLLEIAAEHLRAARAKG